MSVEIGKLELKGIIRRRRKVFFTTSLLVFIICTIIAFVLPSIYKSEVMIVVENQEIPEEYVKSTVTTFVSERLEIITKKILRYQKLLEIIKEHKLYPNLDSDGAMVQKMRDDIDLKTVDVTVRDRASSNFGFATIAFTLSYEYADAEMAKKIADILSNLYVEEDQKVRLKQTTTTTMFLEKELEELRQLVKQHEEKISRFKAENIKQLPGSTAVFSQTIFRLEQDLDNINARIRTNQEKVIYLKSQIANIDPMIPILTEEGEVANNPNNRLKYLRLQLIRMQANLSEKHPDIVRMKSEIKELESQVGSEQSSSEQKNQLAMVEREIVAVRAKYGDRHPDVIRLSKEAELLRQQIASTKGSLTVVDDFSDNPDYMNVKAQIIVAESEIQALRKEKLKVNRKLEDYQQRLETAPFVDEEYNALTLDYENAKKKFNEVSNKLHSAKIAQQMDTSGSGARFRIDFPANLPETAHKPKRLLIVLMGVVLGVGGGLLLAALAEGLDSSVKAVDELESIAGVPVLASVSFVDSPKYKRERRKKLVVRAATAIAAIFCTILIINWFVMPIDDLWAKLETRLIEVGVPIKKESTAINPS